MSLPSAGLIDAGQREYVFITACIAALIKVVQRAYTITQIIKLVLLMKKMSSWLDTLVSEFEPN
jgi:hypothetical protein